MSEVVSILLPVRNAETTLRRSVDSVLQQTYDNFELICIVNSSTDDSEKMLSSYKDNRISVIHSSAGIVPALNAGLKISNSKFVARQDADDYWYPTKLQKQIEFMNNNEGCDILGVQIRSVSVNYEIIRQEPSRPVHDPEIKQALLSGWNVIPHPGVLFRRRIMEKLGGYDDTFLFAEDYSLWLRAIQWYKFANLNEILVDYTSKHNAKYDHRVPQFLSSVFKTFYGVK